MCTENESNLPGNQKYCLEGIEISLWNFFRATEDDPAAVFLGATIRPILGVGTSSTWVVSAALPYLQSVQARRRTGGRYPTETVNYSELTKYRNYIPYEYLLM